MDALFTKWDPQATGKLDYEEFANFLATKGAGTNPNVNPVFGVTREPPNQVIQKVKSTLLKRGMHGIHGLGMIFR